jgi:prevent-host-death family protein
MEDGMITATIFEAKTNLSELVKSAQRGETVIITSGRDRTPVARLEAVHPVRKKRLGALETPGFVLPDAFFEPLPEEELRHWSGEGE